MYTSFDKLSLTSQFIHTFVICKWINIFFRVPKANFFRQEKNIAIHIIGSGIIFGLLINSISFINTKQKNEILLFLHYRM